MTTYNDMRVRIADELVNESITTAQISAAIKSAVKHWERKPFWFNQKVGTFSTVASQELYTSTDLADIENMIRIDSMLVTSSGFKSRVRGVDNSAIEDVQDGTVTGTPSMFSRYADKIRLYPIPDTVYTVTVSYLYKLATLTVNADTNAWTDECEEMIRNAAKRILATDILSADDMAARFATLEMKAYDHILAENRTRFPQTMLRTDVPPSSTSFNINSG